MIKKTKKTAKQIHSFLAAKQIHWLVYGILIFCGTSIFVQLVFPSDYTLPFSRIDALSVGNQQRMQLIETLHRQYEQTQLTINIPGKQTQRIDLSSTGYVPMYNSAAHSALDYPLWQRFIPLSAVYHVLTYRAQVPQEIDADIYAEFAARVASVCHKNPSDAAVEIKSGQVNLKHAVAGQKCDSAQLKQQLESYQMGQTTITVPVTSIDPTITDSKIASQFDQAKHIVDTTITLGSPVEQWEVPREMVASWLTVTNNDKPALVINKDAVRKYLADYRGKTYIAPGQVNIQMLDGIEIQRSIGGQGRGIDGEVTSTRIAESLLKSSIPQTIWVQLVALAPTEIIDRHYSQTDAGMQALIEQWDRENPGRYGIVVRDLSGRNLNAAFNADRDFITASTYKQFLAYAVMHKIEAGHMSFDDGTSTGLSVRGCIEEMILHSTNPCANALMEQADWGWVHEFIRSQFPSTSLNNAANSDNEKHSTVRDEVTFQSRLNAGTLQINSEHHAYLLDLLKRQVYRGGIPRGVPGVVVANKVGFYNGYKHDIAIIYSPRGTYQLGVMSYGGSDAQFADLSRRVAALMSR